MSASAPYVLAALIRATLCDGNWCGTVDANGTGSSSEAEISSYLWIFRPCQRLGKLFFLLKYLYQLYTGVGGFSDPPDSVTPGHCVLGLSDPPVTESAGLSDPLAHASISITIAGYRPSMAVTSMSVTSKRVSRSLQGI